MPLHQHPDMEEQLRHYTSLPLHIISIFFDAIAEHVPITSVMALSRTHSTLMSKLKTHLRHSFDRLLASRIPIAKVVNFRALLLDTRAVISGSTALQFVLRDAHWKPGDFDIYAPFGTGYTLAKWLTAHGGYRMVSDGSRNFTFRPHLVALPLDDQHEWDLGFSALHRSTQAPQPDEPHYETPGSNIYRVYKLCTGADTFIDVIESSKLSFLPPITKFHSTLVMNYLTPESLVVLYPALTFRREGILQFRDANTLEEYDPPADRAALHATPQGQDYVAKYKARGFTLSSKPSDFRRPCGAACPALMRTVFETVDDWGLELKFAEPASFARIETRPTHVSVSRSIGESGPGHRPSDDALNINLSPAQHCSDHREPSPLSQMSIASGPHDSIPTTMGSESQGLLAKKLTRPPLPATSWSLRAPPLSRRTGGLGGCVNRFCPLRGHSPGLRVLGKSYD